MDIQQRLAEFFRRLKAAPAVGSAEEALALVCRLIEQVEDELCLLPRQYPAPVTFTGRMYAPKDDRVERFANGLIVATTRRHRIYCRPNGGISVVHIRSGITVLNTKGKNERSG